MPPLFSRGSRFSSSTSEDNRWAVVRKLGEGQFAEVHEVKDTLSRERETRYACKIDKRRDIKSVKQELKVLQRLQELSVHGVCQTIATGTYEERSFIVMELLGPNLAELKRDGGGHFQACVVRCVGLSTLSALQGMHDAGYLHRDVKPANFALFPPDSTVMQGVFKVIDFGLARRYTDDSGAVLAQRPDASFRGSTTYASIHAHMEQDLGRRDDLWSWLYCLVELLEGTLPWRADAAAAAAREADGAASASGRELRERVRELKQQCVEQPQLLARNKRLPDALLHISNHLRGLAFADAPDYGFIRACLMHMDDAAAAAARSASGTANAAWEQQQQQQQQAWQHAQQAQQQYQHPYHPAPSARDTPLSPMRDTPLSPAEDGAGGASAAHAAEAGAMWAAQQQQQQYHQQQQEQAYQFQQQQQQQQQQYQLQLQQQHVHPQQQQFQPNPAAAAAEERALKTFSEVAAAIQMGLLSPESHQLQQRLRSLHPMEALSVMASVIQDAAEAATEPASAHVLAQVLGDLAVFTQIKARQAAQQAARLEPGQGMYGAPPAGQMGGAAQQFQVAGPIG